MKNRVLSAYLGALFLSTTAFGAAITNVTVTAQFKNSVDNLGGSPTISPAGAAAVTRVSWGVPPGALGQSNYEFAAINQPAVPNIAGPIAVNPPAVTPYFTLGTFTHNNFVVDEPWLDSVDLDIILSFQIDGNPTGPHTFTYHIDHTETYNFVEDGSPKCPFSTPIGQECVDQVLLSGVAPQVINIGGVNYTLELAFQVGGSTVTEFLTAEGQANVAEIVARFSATNSEVPEPGTLTAVGLGLVALASRRFRRRA